MSRSNVSILWNQLVQTDRTNPNDKPDITIRDNEKGTCVLMNVVIAGDRNVIRKENFVYLYVLRITTKCLWKSDRSFQLLLTQLRHSEKLPVA